MNIHAIVENWLVSEGYDGLCNVEMECGCKVGDLMPCCVMDDLLECVPAQKVMRDDGDWIMEPANKEENHENHD